MTTPENPEPSLTYPRMLTGGLLVTTALIGLAWLTATPPGVLGKATAIGYAVCHRIAERSFHVHGEQLPLCARCTGIYLGVMIGIAFFAARGRVRANRFPALRWLLPLLALGGTIAIDGINSYLSLFEFYTPIYQPHNTLRLFTGLVAGAAMITVVLPVFNATVWRAPRRDAPITGWRDLAALLVALALAGLLVLTRLSVVLWIAGVISALDVALMFGIVGAALFVSFTHREATARRWRDLAIPALAGLLVALAIIGGIDAVRFALTGTWDGFNLSG